jgi:hypothetical protein
VSQRAPLALGGAAVLLETLTCEAREDVVARSIDDVLAHVDRTFVADHDCVRVEARVSCDHSCSLAAVSGLGAEQLSVALGVLDTGLCRLQVPPSWVAMLPNCDAQAGGATCNRGRCDFDPIRTPQCEVSDLPFDAGNGGAGLRVYWYDARSDTCLPRTYGGEGGNANQAAFASQCEAACVKNEPCAGDRTPAANLCTERGPKAQCIARQGVACALCCTADSECIGDAVGGTYVATVARTGACAQSPIPGVGP